MVEENCGVVGVGCGGVWSTSVVEEKVKEVTTVAAIVVIVMTAAVAHR